MKKHGNLPEVNNSPHIRPEPCSCTLIGLILPNKYRMWNRQQTDQCPMLQEFKYLTLISQSPKNKNKWIQQNIPQIYTQNNT